MHYGQQLYVAIDPFEGPGYLLRGDRPAPFRGNRVNSRPATLGNVMHAQTENSAGAYDDLVPGLDEVREAGLHARAAGTGDRDGKPVLRLKHLSQKIFRVLHDIEELWVEMSDHGRCQGGVHAWMDIAGSGAHEQALRRIQSCRQVLFHIHGIPPEKVSLPRGPVIPLSEEVVVRKTMGTSRI